MRLSYFLAITLTALAAASPLHAANTVNLPSWVCSSTDTLYRSGFQDGELVPHDPSNGSGGVKPPNGKTTRTLQIAGLGTGTQTYYLYLPPNYTPTRSWPLLLALHGTVPWANRSYYAGLIRDDWANIAASQGFIVAAPVANDQVNVGGTPGASWLVPPTFGGPTDYDFFAALVADVQGAYNIERTRRYGWGFSAGAHTMHDLVLNSFSATLNSGTVAAYGVSAGGLQQLLCGGYSDADCSQMLVGVTHKVPVDIHIGDGDPLYVGYGAGDDPTILANGGWINGQTLYYTLVVGQGHTYTATDLSQIWGHLCPYAVTP